MPRCRRRRRAEAGWNHAETNGVRPGFGLLQYPQKYSKLPLRERVYHCGGCGLVLDRDLNAAINLARLGDTTNVERGPVPGVARPPVLRLDKDVEPTGRPTPPPRWGRLVAWKRLPRTATRPIRRGLPLRKDGCLNMGRHTNTHISGNGSSAGSRRRRCPGSSPVCSSRSRSRGWRSSSGAGQRDQRDRLTHDQARTYGQTGVIVVGLAICGLLGLFGSLLVRRWKGRHSPARARCWQALAEFHYRVLESGGLNVPTGRSVGFQDARCCRVSGRGCRAGGARPR
ncbi:transposase [Nocardia sp. NBC_00881]|uniref:zinc ribbon domain-containing protein n=1 Tax=Nocardia sp. NBC_00881 TaxID=2975995 RepID=UPI00386FFFF5|nr:transposase [Nocardia sp. NBC_00881]